MAGSRAPLSSKSLSISHFSFASRSDEPETVIEQVEVEQTRGLRQEGDEEQFSTEEAMGNSLRCFLACVLPCGALDLVRVVHLNGQVDEYSRPVLAGDILAANPYHVLITRSSCPHVVARSKTVVVSADSQLKRGHIYLLMPATTPAKGDREKETKGRARRERARSSLPEEGVAADRSALTPVADMSNCLAEILTESKPRHCRRRSGRIAVWRPHLRSIHEDP